MRIAIVNDMLIAVEAMRRVLATMGKHEIAWVATHGEEALARCQEDRPDLILMDLIMPGMDGVEATRRIMASSPCAILVVTATVEGNSTRVFDAMGAGALDVVQTPVLGGNGSDSGVAGFCYKIDSIARLLGEPAPVTPPARQKPPSGHLVAVGASAGGPAALMVLLRDLPEDFPAAVVIVQHVDAQFAPGLATWLGEHSKLPVRLAAEGDIPSDGTVLIAGTNDHLILRFSGRLIYTPDPADYSYRPSINAFFESAARHWRGHIVGVLLTGMGRDGATGLKMLRNLGHHTIAQDRRTSAVYGMPKAAAEIQAAVEVLPLNCIAETLVSHFSCDNFPPVRNT